MVKHVVKGEKWAYSTIETGKDKPVLFIAKTRDFKRFSGQLERNEDIAEKIDTIGDGQ